MSKKKSYMNISNILSEGIIEFLFKRFSLYPKIRNSPEIKKSIDDLNKSTEKFVKSANALIVKNNEKLKKKDGAKAKLTKPIKFKKVTVKDITVSKG